MDIKYGLNHELDPVKQPWAGRDHYFKFDQELQLACCLSSHHAEKKKQCNKTTPQRPMNCMPFFLFKKPLHTIFKFQAVAPNFKKPIYAWT